MIHQFNAKSALVSLHNALVKQRGLREFIRLAWPLVEPSIPFVPNWHIDAVAEHLQAVSRHQIRDLIINIPPGSGKSLLVSVFWPAWEWIENQGTRFVFASFDLGLPRRDGRRSLELLTSPWFQDRWGDVVDAEQPVLEYRSRAGGLRYGTSVRGKVTGNHFHVRVVDDPIKPLDVSRNNLEMCLEWWDGTMSTRLVDPKTSRSVVMMQRLAHNDLAGSLKDRGSYEVLELPMRFEKRRTCVTSLGLADPRKEEGELLNPVRVDEKALDKMEAELGPQGTAAQMQQRPTPEGGNIFTLAWLAQEYTTLPPSVDQWVMSVDATFKGSDTSDFVCISVWCRAGVDYYLVDLTNERLSFTETLIRIREMATRYPRCIVKLVEDAANGPAVVDVLKKEIVGLELVKPKGGKEARANAVTVLFRGGNVWLPSGKPWLAKYREQLTTFPLGNNDDMVDSTSQALSWMLENVSNFAKAMAAVRDQGKK